MTQPAPQTSPQPADTTSTKALVKEVIDDATQKLFGDRPPAAPCMACGGPNGETVIEAFASTIP